MLAALKKKTSSLTISSVLTSESSNKYNSKSGKRDNESAICFAFLMQPTGKYCSIYHTEYPEFQSGILGPYFYVLFECYYYYCYFFFLVFFFFFYLWNFFPVTRFLVTSLLVTRYSVTLFSNTLENPVKLLVLLNCKSTNSCRTLLKHTVLVTKVV